MDDSTKQQPEPPQPPHQSRHHKRKYSSKKKWVIIGAVAVVISSAVFGWYVIYGQKSNSPEIVTRTTDQIQQIISDADAQLNSGNVSAAKSTYEQAIGQTSDAAQKSSLLMSSASLYYEEGNYDQALTLAKQAESYKLDENVASMTAEIYKMDGDKQNAVLYYQKSISLIDKENSVDDNALYYQNQIDILSGVKK